MKVKIFSVFDSKAGYYLPPFLFKSVGEAVRGFADLANDEGHQFCRHGGDFSLFEIAVWNDQNGEITMYDAPISLGTALSFQKVEAVDFPKVMEA